MTTEQHTLRDLLSVQSRRLEKKSYLEFEGLRYSYAEMDEKTDRAATGLHRMGLNYGDRVAVLLSNRPELAFFLLGAPKIGIIPVLIDPGWPDAGQLLEKSQAAAVISESSFDPLRCLAPGIQKWVTVDEASFDEAPFHGLDRGTVLGFWPDLASDDTALIAFTRGTRGPRKAVALSHRNLLSNCHQIVQPFRIDATDRFYCAVPITTSFAEALLLLVPLIVGGSCILQNDFLQKGPCAIRDSRATIIAAGPAFYSALVSREDFGQYELSSLRLALCAQGPITEAVLRRFEEHHDAIIVEAYGLTEATCLTCTNPYTGLRKAGSVGLPLPGQECRVLDERGLELPAGAPGEIVVRGTNVMKEYCGDRNGTAKALRDGWLHTGDYGLTDSDGFYYLFQKP